MSASGRGPSFPRPRQEMSGRSESFTFLTFSLQISFCLPLILAEVAALCKFLEEEEEEEIAVRLIDRNCGRVVDMASASRARDRFQEEEDEDVDVEEDDDDDDEDEDEEEGSSSLEEDEEVSVASGSVHIT